MRPIHPPNTSAVHSVLFNRGHSAGYHNAAINRPIFASNHHEKQHYPQRSLTPTFSTGMSSALRRKASYHSANKVICSTLTCSRTPHFGAFAFYQSHVVRERKTTDFLPYSFLLRGLSRPFLVPTPSESLSSHLRVQREVVQPVKVVELLTPRNGW